MARRVRVRPSSQSRGRLRELAMDYASLKHREREVETARKAVGGDLLPMMQEQKITKEHLDFDEDTDATVQVKTREKMEIQADRLKKAIGAQRFNKLTTPVLDESKVEAAIALGDIDPNVVASCTETTETPYLEVRFVRKRKKRL